VAFFELIDNFFAVVLRNITIKCITSKAARSKFIGQLNSGNFCAYKDDNAIIIFSF